MRVDHEFVGKDNRGDGITRQWFTRLLYMAMTPFELTLAYDTNVACCKDLTPAITALEATDFDFAVATQRVGTLIPHNFAIVFKWNKRTERLFERWLVAQLMTGLPVDDQHSLGFVAKPMAEDKELKLRALDASLSAAYVSIDGKNRFYPRATRRLDGSVYMIHTKPNNGDEMCARFNKYAPTPRVMVSSKVNGTLKSDVSVFDENACTNQLGSVRCPPFFSVNVAFPVYVL